MVHVIRYIIAILLPVMLLLFDSRAAVASAFLCLLLNNWIDDIVFYLGSTNVDRSKCRGGISSPVNGVITCIEENVRMYHHLIKCDVLTNEEYIRLAYDNKYNALYNHISIFLNKLNKHVVCNVGFTPIAIKEFKGDSFEMVYSNNLLADNRGDYLNNTFYEIEYENGVRVIVTMDKYISKAISLKDHSAYGAEMLICRGSQADIYIPAYYKLDVELHQKVDIFQTLTKTNTVGIIAEPTNYKKIISYGVNKSGFTIFGSLIENAKKTISTFSFNKVSAVLLLLFYLFGHIELFMCLYIYSFLLNRSTKMLMYSIMNITGYKKYMTTIYRTINFVTLWQRS